MVTLESSIAHILSPSGMLSTSPLIVETGENIDGKGFVECMFKVALWMGFLRLNLVRTEKGTVTRDSIIAGTHLDVLWILKSLFFHTKYVYTHYSSSHSFSQTICRQAIVLTLYRARFDYDKEFSEFWRIYPFRSQVDPNLGNSHQWGLAASPQWDLQNYGFSRSRYF